MATPALARAEGGRRIRWYETATAVLGYVPGTSSGYRVPIEAMPSAWLATGEPAMEARASDGAPRRRIG